MWKLKLGYFVFFVGLSFFGRFYSLFLRYQNLSEYQIGVIFSVQFLVQLAVKPLWSKLADLLQWQYIVFQITVLSSIICGIILILPRLFFNQHNSADSSHSIYFFSQLLVNSLFMATFGVHLSLINTMTSLILNDASVDATDADVDAETDNNHNRYQNYGKHRLFGTIAWGIFHIILSVSLDTYLKIWVIVPCYCVFNVVISMPIYHICYGRYAILGTAARDSADEMLYFAFLDQIQRRKHLKSSQTANIDRINDDNNIAEAGNEVNRKTPIDSTKDSNGGATIEMTQFDATVQSSSALPRSSQQSLQQSLDILLPNSVPNNVSLSAALYQIVTNRESLIVYITVFVIGGVQSVIANLLFLTLMNEFGSEIKWIYTLFGLSVMTSVIFEIPFLASDRLANRFEWRASMIIAMVCLIIRVLSYNFLNSNNLWFLLCIEPLHGIILSMMNRSCSIYVQQLFPPQWNASAQAILTAIRGGMGPFVFVLANGYILQYTSPYIMYCTCGAAVCIALVVFYLATTKRCSRLQPLVPELIAPQSH